MATLSDIKITWEYRPCYVNDKKALFHRWADKEQVIIKVNCNVPYDKAKTIAEYAIKNFVLDNDCDVEKVAGVFAIVEYEDGTIAEVDPIKIRFADRKINEYAFDFDFDKKVRK